MNLILLEESDFVAAGRVCLRGRRLEHVRAVHRAAVGDRLRVGLLAGRLGAGEVAHLDAERLEMEVVLDQAPPPKLPLTLALALPRPNVLHRVLQAAAAMGVPRLLLMHTRRVEKSFWSSPALAPDNLRAQLLLGLEQARDTVLPEVTLHQRFRPVAEDLLPGLAAGARALVAHPEAAIDCPRAVAGAVTLAIGPEGGFIPFEIDTLAAHGFEAVTLGPRILRVEHALPALLARLFEIAGRELCPLRLYRAACSAHFVRGSVGPAAPAGSDWRIGAQPAHFVRSGIAIRPAQPALRSSEPGDSRSHRTPIWSATVTNVSPRILPAFLVLLVAGCTEKPTETARPAKPVVLAEVEARDVEERISATGELLAKSRAEVASQVAGEVTRILHDEGAIVRAGEVVLEIDPERRQLDLAQARAQVDEARSALRHAEREMARMGTLKQGNIASKSDFDTAEMGAETAKSRLDAAVAGLGVAERIVRDASVSTRFDGVIARRFVSTGEFVQPGQKLFELVALDPIEVEFYVSEVDSGRVHVGQTLAVTVAPLPEETFEATVTLVSPTIDPRTRALRIKALLPNPEGRLRPGLFARADLGIARRPGVLMVPEEALLQRVDGSVLYRLQPGNRAERMVVETGPIRAGWVEVRSRVAAGDKVILRGHANLVDGATVAVREADGGEAVADKAASGGASK